MFKQKSILSLLALSLLVFAGCEAGSLLTNPEMDSMSAKIEASDDAVSNLQENGYETSELAVGGDSAARGISLSDSNYARIISQSGTQAVVEVDLRPSGYAAKTKVLLSCYYSTNPTGWLLNIGDSITNNGYAGDSGTQSNDAEAEVVVGSTNTYLHALANDYGGSSYLTNEAGHIPLTGNRNVRYEISNNKLKYWKNFETSSTVTVQSPYLYALAGQSDSTGPVNYKIYIGINRVIHGPGSRVGTGLENIYIYVQ